MSGSANEAIYLDYAASTPMLTEVFEAMVPYMRDHYANPTGMHRLAQSSRAAVDNARDQIAEAFGMPAGGVIFCGSGTEADNLAVLGTGTKAKVWCSAIEHHAVIDCVKALEGREIPVNHVGQVDLEALDSMFEQAKSVGEYPDLVSVMISNNEIGTLQDLAQIKRLISKKSPTTLLHTDAVNAFPWVDVRSISSFVDLISASAHKVGGPKGVGVLCVGDNVKIRPQILGGGQERERRSGTQNVAGIVGAGVAFSRAALMRSENVVKVTGLRNQLGDAILGGVTEAAETVPRELKTASNLHMTFEGFSGEELLLLLDQNGVCASASSSCSSGAIEPSHVMAAIDIPLKRARAALRLTLGNSTTENEVARAAQIVVECCDRLRDFA